MTSSTRPIGDVVRDGVGGHRAARPAAGRPAATSRDSTSSPGTVRGRRSPPDTASPAPPFRMCGEPSLVSARSRGSATSTTNRLWSRTKATSRPSGLNVAFSSAPGVRGQEPGDIGGDVVVGEVVADRQQHAGALVVQRGPAARARPPSSAETPGSLPERPASSRRSKSGVACPVAASTRCHSAPRAARGPHVRAVVDPFGVRTDASAEVHAGRRIVDDVDRQRLRPPGRVHSVAANAIHSHDTKQSRASVHGLRVHRAGET